MPRYRDEVDKLFREAEAAAKAARDAGEPLPWGPVGAVLPRDAYAAIKEAESLNANAPATRTAQPSSCKETSSSQEVISEHQAKDGHH